PAIHLESFACYVPGGQETLHIKHLLLSAYVSLIDTLDVESLFHSLYRQIYILQLFQKVKLFEMGGAENMIYEIVNNHKKRRIILEKGKCSGFYVQKVSCFVPL